MEYLMTYGWAILIVIIVVAALWAMGVFTVTSPVACSPCFSYLAFRDYNSGTGELLLINGPRHINITNVVGAGTPATTDYTAGQSITLTVTDTTSATTTVTITYDDVDGVSGHTDTATMHNA